MRNAVDKRFGRLFAVKQDGAYVSCKCDCGRDKIVRVDHLYSGGTQSCGCFQAETRIATHLKHGFNRHGKRRSEYRSWVCMRERCNNPKNNEFHRYGAKGIKVCRRWNDSFENFIADMGCKPLPSHSIDRFPDKAGNYEPGNCRWATPKEQARNAQSNKIVSAFGRSQILVSWAEEFGVDYSLVQSRIARGWDAERALTTPPDMTRARKAA